jgi:hypothetical protein
MSAGAIVSRHHCKCRMKSYESTLALTGRSRDAVSNDAKT